jgi:hypothetical protein
MFPRPQANPLPEELHLRGAIARRMQLQEGKEYQLSFRMDTDSAMSVDDVQVLFFSPERFYSGILEDPDHSIILRTDTTTTPLPDTLRARFTAFNNGDMVLIITAGAMDTATPTHFYLDNIQLREGWTYTTSCDPANLLANGGEDGYRFGFQGQETELEYLDGAISFKYRINDPRIGKFLSIDPLMRKYPYYSPYSFSGNRVIDAIELEGAEPIPAFVLEFGRDIEQKIQGFKDVVNETTKTLERALWFVIKLTDANDAYILSSYAFDNAKNIDQTPADNEDVSWAKIGMAIPIVSGATIKQLSRIGLNKNLISTIHPGIKATSKLSEESKSLNNIIQGNKSLKNSFRSGKYDIVEAQEDLIVYRVSGGSSPADGGAFFGTIKPQNASEAESLYNIKKWGNEAESLTPVTIKKGTQFAIGNVEGGKGTQIFLPEFIQNKGSNKVVRHLEQSKKL